MQFNSEAVILLLKTFPADTAYLTFSPSGLNVSVSPSRSQTTRLCTPAPSYPCSTRIAVPAATLLGTLFLLHTLLDSLLLLSADIRIAYNNPTLLLTSHANKLVSSATIQVYN